MVEVGGRGAVFGVDSWMPANGVAGSGARWVLARPWWEVWNALGTIEW